MRAADTTRGVRRHGAWLSVALIVGSLGLACSGAGAHGADEGAPPPPDAGAGDAALAELGPPDAAAPDAGLPDAGTPDAGSGSDVSPDTALPDATPPELPEPDAGADFGPPDASLPDGADTPDGVADVARPDGGRDTGPELPPWQDVSQLDPSVPIASLRFEPPTPWAEPIADYIEAGHASVGSWAFMRGIHDLAVFADRLYLGYGDANLNLGRVVPITFRAFPTPNRAATETEFTSAEEQLDHYRVWGELLYMPGVDATEDAWLGNVYVRTGAGAWTKSRTLEGGVHVHDVAAFGPALYAVGSGATPEEWEAGDIYAHLWVSPDQGQTFAIQAREHNGGQGDTRWTRLLPVGDRLYLFGYKTNAAGSTYALPNATFDGETVTMLGAGHPLAGTFALETDVLPDGSGLVRGVDATADPLVARVWHVFPDGSVQRVEALVGRTVADVATHAETGETLLVTFDGDDYLRSLYQTRFDVRIVVTSDLASFQELTAFETNIPPRAIAYWRGGLYYGNDWGDLWRTLGVPGGAAGDR